MSRGLVIRSLMSRDGSMREEGREELILTYDIWGGLQYKVITEHDLNIGVNDFSFRCLSLSLESLEKQALEQDSLGFNPSSTTQQLYHLGNAT